MTTRADATAAPPPAPPDEVGVGDLWPVLRRNWWIVALCVGLAGGAALLYVATAERVYEAVASLRIEPQQTRFTSIGPQPVPAASNQVQSEMLELQSRQLAGEVAQALGLQLAVGTPGVARADILDAVQVAPRVAARELALERDGGGERLRLVDRTTGRTLASAAPGGTIVMPGVRVTLAPGAARHAPVELALVPLDAAAEALQEATSIGRPNAEADIVTVRHEGTDPALVQAVVDEWTARFLARRQRAQTSEARSAVRFLREQLDTLGTQLAASERALREFRERERVVDIETQASTQVSRLAELQASRTQLDAEREALAGVLGDVRRTARGEDRTGYRRLAAFPSLLRSQATAELLSTLAQLEDQRAELLVRRELRDPDVIVLTQRIADVEEQLRGVAETYLQGLTGQVGALDASLARSGRELERLPARQVELARLQRTPQALGEIFTTLQTRLKEAQVAQAIDDPGVRLIDAATLPDEPVKPKPALVLGLGLIVGAGLGVALALLRGHLDRRLHAVGAAQALLGVPLLGAVPRLRVTRRRPRGAATPGARDTRAPGVRASSADALLPAAATDGDSPGGEAFRRLRTNLLVLARHEDRPPRTLLVASALPEDGRTLCATNLAAAFARQGLRTLLVDADLRAGAVAPRLGLRPERGLSELLANGVHPTATPPSAGVHAPAASSASAPRAGELALALAATVQVLALPDGGQLAVLGAGRTPSNPAELLGTPRFGALLASAREAYDVVVVDAPPVRASTDADVVAGVVDGVVLVVRMGHTTSDALRYAAEQLRNVDARVLGLVANDVRGAQAT